MIASSISEGVHSASGNLSTAASLRSAADNNEIGVALIDGTAAADKGNASVGVDGSSSSKVKPCRLWLHCHLRGYYQNTMLMANIVDASMAVCIDGGLKLQRHDIAELGALAS